MQHLNLKAKVTCLKSKLSKELSLSQYTPYKARCIFDFYANHKDYLIELV